MKKRVLFIAAQLFQVMVSWQIRSTELKDEHVDLILQDGSSGMRSVYERISETSYFDNVYLVRKETYKNYAQKIHKAFLMFVFDRKLKYLDEFGFEPEFDYDEVYLNNFSHFSIMLIQKLSKYHDVKVYRFEEGYGSYLDEYCFQKRSTTAVFNLKNTISPILGLTDIVRLVEGDYFFFPELKQFKTDRNTYKIPSFDWKDEKLKSFLQCAFGSIAEDEFDRKYIFFEEYITDKGIDDFSLIMKIAEKVGKDNLMIKLHPRRPIDRFSEYGIKVSKATGIPWEAILLQQDFSDKVLMTISSSVAFSARLYLNSNIETYMLFKLFDKINPAIPNQEKFLCYVDDFRRVYNDKLFSVPDNMESFLKMLTRLYL